MAVRREGPRAVRRHRHLDHVLALSRVGNVVLPVRVPTGPVYSEATVVFALDGFADLAVRSSSVHVVWAVRSTSTMRTDIRYAPSDVFLTLPRPQPTPELATLGVGPAIPHAADTAVPPKQGRATIAESRAEDLASRERSS